MPQYVNLDGVQDEILLPQTPIAIVRHLYAAYAERDIPGILSVLSDDIDWLFAGPRDIPFAGHYYGHEQVAHFFATSFAVCDFEMFEPREFIEGTSTVLVQGFERGRAKSTNRTWETEWAHVFTLSDCQIVKMREYYDTSIVAAAFRPQ